MATKPLLTLTVVRRLTGVTQDELAERLHLHQASLSYWESGLYPIPTKTAKRILRVLWPKLHEPGSINDATGEAVRNLTPEDLSKPWDEVLLAAAAKMEAAG